MAKKRKPAGYNALKKACSLFERELKHSRRKKSAKSGAHYLRTSGDPGTRRKKAKKKNRSGGCGSYALAKKRHAKSLHELQRLSKLTADGAHCTREYRGKQKLSARIAKAAKEVEKHQKALRVAENRLARAGRLPSKRKSPTSLGEFMSSGDPGTRRRRKKSKSRRRGKRGQLTGAAKKAFLARMAKGRRKHHRGGKRKSHARKTHRKSHARKTHRKSHARRSHRSHARKSHHGRRHHARRDPSKKKRRTSRRRHGGWHGDTKWHRVAAKRGRRSYCASHKKRRSGKRKTRRDWPGESRRHARAARTGWKREGWCGRDPGTRHHKKHRRPSKRRGARRARWHY